MVDKEENSVLFDYTSNKNLILWSNDIVIRGQLENKYSG